MTMNIAAKIVAPSSARPGALTEPGEKTSLKFGRRFAARTLFNQLVDRSFPVFFAALLGVALSHFVWAVCQLMMAKYFP
jgi:hypothetical protein